MKSNVLNVFIVYTDQDASNFAVYAAKSAEQALALHREANPSRVRWDGDVNEVSGATCEGAPRRLVTRVIFNH